jgi:hypothetical protein
VLLAADNRPISRHAAHGMTVMADVLSSVGEDMMLWGGCTKHRVPRCRLFKNRQLLVHLGLDPVGCGESTDS